MRGGRGLFATLILLAGIFTAPAAHAWWNDEWQFRKELRFDLSAAGAAIGQNATDVPVLVRLSIANFPYFADAKPDGADLRFIAGDDKTPLKFHVEKFDAQTQIGLVWVKVPLLTGGANADRIFLYYGNQKATAGADAAGTYDSNQSLAYHFAAATGPQDSAGYRNEPQAPAGESNPGSLIGAGTRFAGQGAMTVAAAPSLKVVAAQGYTVSAWVKPEGSQQSTIAAVHGDGRELVLGLEGDRAFARWRDAGRDVTVRQAQGSLTDGWHHLALRIGGGRLSLLLDGTEAGTADAALQDMNGALSIAGLGTASFYRGELDELQVSNTARSDGWLRAAATSQGMVAPLVIYGGDAQKEGAEGGESYITSTLRNVTVDGWVIIAILAVLFMASVFIMLGKVVFLNRVAKGNSRFLAEFHRLRDDPAALERREGSKMDDSEESAFEEGSSSSMMSMMHSKDDAFGISTLWRLYHHGMRETLKRLEGRTAGAARVQSLTPQAIDAIRATMDATLTRLQQRMSSQMVWLTISIAGGPFLGLLGTVVGVMITFAAIAASGEVNINAIAPGTAAALVATVAGLGVAIPCLFGYNYLNTRIKEIVADMRVFVDEFVTRIAETYA